ncbi:aldo/keto reductase [Bradyrhizobium lablabi]|uniref:aldo/keto reductase n=1 Tax=Bradyrhizobium lablabi TaxID=722472 RepID=UPI001BADCC44|nr:aldo/keto reductase [Bradyrhizobium lablabi]MBR0692328.1 aldo/keto reductase [Bradyrhizobium lablabi]
MKLVLVEAIGAQVSRIGFGCASLGSRVGTRKGLETLERAYDAGISWYDVSPSYGDGMAESILGEFAARKRNRVYVCTKVGMRPPATPAAMRLLKPLSRVAVAALPALKRYASRVRPAPYKVPLSAELITTSVEESLRRLRTDYVDVLALHRPAVEELVREDVVRALERIVQAGKARAVSIAGDLAAGMKGLDKSLPYRLVQVANTPFEPNLETLRERASPGKSFVTYGTFACLAQLVAQLNERPEIPSALHGLGYRGHITDIAAAFLADYAFASNPGVTLFSMLHREHLDFNLQRLGNYPTREQLDSVVTALLEGARRADPMPNSPLSRKKPDVVPLRENSGERIKPRPSSRI